LSTIYEELGRPQIKIVHSLFEVLLLFIVYTLLKVLLNQKKKEEVEDDQRREENTDESTSMFNQEYLTINLFICSF